MATEPCEVMGQNEDYPEPIKEREIPAEEMQKQVNKEKQGDAAVMTNQEAGTSTPNGIEKEEGGSLHVVEKDLDEFVDSVTEVAPSGLPEKSLEETKPPLSEKAPMKAPRAEQIAEKVLRAEKVPEKTPQAEKIPGREKTPEPKAARAEKTPRPQEKKPPEKARPAAPAAAKPVRRKTEARGKDTVPWEGLTLNKCLLVASFVALLSVGCQVFQEIIEYSENVLKTELEAWTSESSVGELEEQWFYERWLDWSDDEEPLEMEEEEEEEEVLEMEGEEEEEEEEPELIDIEEKEEEEEEETEEVPVSKGSPRKIREKAVRREKVSRGRARKDREPVGKVGEEEEEEEEEPPSHGRRHRREGKAKREPQRQEEEGKSHHQEGRDRGKGRPKPERDSRPRRLEPKIAPRPSSSLSKEGTHKFGRHKVREARRQD